MQPDFYANQAVCDVDGDASADRQTNPKDHALDKLAQSRVPDWAEDVLPVFTFAVGGSWRALFRTIDYASSGFRAPAQRTTNHTADAIRALAAMRHVLVTSRGGVEPESPWEMLTPVPVSGVEHRMSVTGGAAASHDSESWLAKWYEWAGARLVVLDDTGAAPMVSFVTPKKHNDCVCAAKATRHFAVRDALILGCGTLAVLPDGTPAVRPQSEGSRTLHAEQRHERSVWRTRHESGVWRRRATIENGCRSRGRWCGWRVSARDGSKPDALRSCRAVSRVAGVREGVG